jgi:hypothetical protein
MTDDHSSQSTPAVRLAEDELAQGIVARVDEIIGRAESETKPLEVDPYRGQLFELFVTAEAAGYVGEAGDFDLSADGLCHQLSERWGLKQAAEQSFSQQSNLPPSHLQKMRSLWSIMRMWMEWSYAWSRWEEFHDASN